MSSSSCRSGGERRRTSSPRCDRAYASRAARPARVGAALRGERVAERAVDVARGAGFERAGAVRIARDEPRDDRFERRGLGRGEIRRTARPARPARAPSPGTAATAPSAALRRSISRRDKRRFIEPSVRERLELGLRRRPAADARRR